MEPNDAGGVEERPGTHRAGRTGRPVRTAVRWSLPGWGSRPAPVWVEVLGLLVVAVLLSVMVKAMFLQTFYVPSESMEPTLTGSLDGPKDRIVVQKVSYWGREPGRGEVVVFRDPGGWLRTEEVGEPSAAQRLLSTAGLYPSGGHLVKRVIGVGGDRVQCCDTQGRIEVNGLAIEEDYVLDTDATALSPFDVTVPDGYLWVMGDNRANSGDSRAHAAEPGGGFVPTDMVVGKVAFIVWPWADRAVLDDPPVFDDLD